jgi:hypothetical protein
MGALRSLNRREAGERHGGNAEEFFVEQEETEETEVEGVRGF